MQPRKAPRLTPCGYPVGPLRSADGLAVYMVRESGQIVRTRRKMSKAERKAARRDNVKRLKSCIPGVKA